MQTTAAKELPTAAHSYASAAAEDLGATLAAGLDRLAHGVAVVDSCGRTLFTNASARMLLARLGCSGNVLERSPSAADWAGALQRVCRRGRRELLTFSVQAGSCTALLSPLGKPPEGLAFVLFGRDELCGSVELQMFALRHQLTPAETQVLRHLCRGLKANDIARDHGVSRTTVLTQIAAIRTKTGSGSVRDLLATLARLPQLVPLQAVGGHGSIAAAHG